jgi:hypothetical protein
LTREGYDDALALKETLYLFGKPATTKQGLMMVRSYWSRSVIQEFLSRQVVLQAAAEQKHPVSEEALRLSRLDMCRVMKVKEPDLERKLTELGRVGRSLKHLMEENALIRSFRESEHGASLQVTPAEVDARIQALQAYHARAEATNQLVLARGRMICEQLKKGEDFIKLAEVYCEAGETPKGVWGSFLRGELDDPKVREAAFSLPVGSVSEPIDTEEGLVILKVLDRTTEVLGPTVAPTEPATVTLGRIFLRMAEGGAGAPLPSREEVEKALATEKVVENQRLWLPALMKKASIEYPNGTNLWLRAKTNPSFHPQPGMNGQAKEEMK